MKLTRRESLVATLVSVHAHPDDEAIACAGTIAKSVAQGHRAVIVSATGGEMGEVAEGFLRPGETLAGRRAAELQEAGRILGAERVVFLGYMDSGMMGTPANDAPGAFWTAEVGEAATRLATLLQEEEADAVTIYDSEGTYGHPDHMQVHRVGVRAAELAGTPLVYESVVNRDEVRRLAPKFAEFESSDPPVDVDEEGLGVPEEVITHAVDVSDYLALKRSAMAAHASQISETSMFLAMPPDLFGEVFGTEWYTLRGAEPVRPMQTTLLG
ncbi:PIG-L family deacetylase [soil metagenome]